MSALNYRLFLTKKMESFLLEIIPVTTSRQKDPMKRYFSLFFYPKETYYPRISLRKPINKEIQSSVIRKWYICKSNDISTCLRAYFGKALTEALERAERCMII